jgi:hypothetical protein
MGDTYRYTDSYEVFMKYAVEMDSGAMIYAKFHKDWFAMQKLTWGIHRHIDTEW